MKDFFDKLFRKTKEDVSPHPSRYTPLDKEQYKKYNKERPNGAQKLFCYVPFTNMTFSFRGRVLACAYNQKVELGKYPDQSIKEMWFDSEMGNELRDHMEHNDLSYGCKHCKYFFDNSKFSGLKPLVFDKYADNKRGEYPQVLEFELSNTCNFECVMCNGEVSSSIRKNRDKLPPIKIPYDDTFVEELRAFIPHIKEAKFYGGEPFLIPIYFKIWDLILELNPSVRIFVITNGSVLNSRVKGLLERGNFDIGVSMDSTRKEKIESIRLNVQHEKLLENIAYFHNYAKGRDNNLTISFTMMRLNWNEFPDVIKFCNERHISLYVSYLKTPPQFALWNLPAKELKEIRLSLEDMDWPKNNYIEKSNAKCFSDFMTYLKNCEEENKQKEELEANTKNSVKPTAPKEVSSSTEKKSDYLENKDYEAVFEHKLKTYFQSTDSLAEKDIYAKLESSFNLVSNQANLNKVYFVMCKTPTDLLVKDINQLSIEEMVENIERHI